MKSFTVLAMSMWGATRLIYPVCKMLTHDVAGFHMV